MRRFSIALASALGGLSLSGCTTSTPMQLPSRSYTEPPPYAMTAPAEPSGIRQAADFQVAPDVPPTLGGLIDLTLSRNPRLAEVGWAVDAARGQAIQAGLYPNPRLDFNGNEIADVQGPSGILGVFASQEFVTANKLGLSQAAAFKQFDQAHLALLAERYRVITTVRAAYFEAITLQRRADILDQLVKLAEESVANAEKLLKAKEAARLEVVQLEVDLERYRAEREAVKRALPATVQKVAAAVGVETLAAVGTTTDLDIPLPDYDLEKARVYLLSIHPDVLSAQRGVERARLLVQRAEVEPIPNITAGAGYTYQGQNRSNDFDLLLSMPVPVWNRNQGNILAARAELGQSINRVGRVQNELTTQLSTQLGLYVSARERAARYRQSILPKAEETFQLSMKAYQGGQFEYLRVLAAQRTVAEARLELIRSLGEAWQSGASLAGLLLEDQWPPMPAPVAELPPPQE